MAIETQAFTGFHSIIEVGQHSSGFSYLDKQYGEKSGGMTRDQAEHLVALMQRFDAKAAEVEVPVAHPLGYFVTDNSHPGQVTLHETVRFGGPSIKQLAQSGELSREELDTTIKGVLDLQGKVFRVGWPISLDPPLANFCRNEDGSLVYVDKMPPRQTLDNGTRVVDFPEPNPENHQFISDRYFSPHQARVICAQIMRDVHGQLDPKRLQEMIGTALGDRAFQAVDIGPEMEWSILTFPDPRNIDTLRLLAGRLMPTKAELEQIYKLTHIGVGGVLPTIQETAQACALLKERSQAANQVKWITIG